jgi:hypothetical protein
MSSTTQVALKPIHTETALVRIVGITPLITHSFPEKGKEQMRQKHAGKKTRDRSVRDPQAECDAATYWLSDRTPGFPVTGIKRAMFAAAHKDIGVTKTLISRAVFIQADEGLLTRIESPGSKMREDVVRVGMGSADLRYRPCWEEWSMSLRVEYDTEWITLDVIVNLLERAGFGIGLGEWRPEKAGEFGRFRVERKG